MTTVGDAVALTGMRPTNGWEPVIVGFDNAGKPVNYLLSQIASQTINGQALYLTSGWFDPQDITPYSGRKRENVKRIPWLPFDFDIADYTGLPRERVYEWPQHHIDDVILSQIDEVTQVFAILGLPIHRMEYTGHGLSVYIYLPKHGPDDVAEYQRIHAALVDRINVIAGSQLADPQVKDAGSRVTRLIPSPNTKSNPPRQTRTLEFQSFAEAPVTLEQLREAAGNHMASDREPPQIVPATGELLSSELVTEIVNAVRPSWQMKNRHALALGLSGMLAKAGVPEEQTNTIIRALAEGDEELADRLKAVETSYSRIRAGQKVRGYHTLLQAIDAESLQWLDESLERIRKATSPQIVIGSGKQSAPGRQNVEFLEPPDAAFVGWIGEYHDLVAPTTEAPSAYHLGVGLALAGSIIGRRICTEYNSDPLYTNLFLVLVGESNKSKKDTAIKRATRLLTSQINTKTSVLNHGVHVVTDVGSSTALLQDLQDFQNLLLYFTELSRVIGNARRKGTETILPTLMEAFDTPTVMHNRSMASPIEAKFPYVSMMAATQPAILADLMTGSDMMSGFANRLFFVCGSPTSPMAIAPSLDREALTALLMRLWQVRQSYEEGAALSMSRDAQELWKDWYDREWYLEEESVEMESLKQRHHVMIQKIALLYSICDGLREITLEHLQRAIQIRDWMWWNLQPLAQAWGRSIDGQIEELITVTLKRHGAMKRRDLQIKCSRRKWSSVEFARVFDAMVRNGMLNVDAFGVVTHEAR